MPGRASLFPMIQFLFLLLGASFLAAPSFADEPYKGPIFDAHVHYSRTAWDEVPPDAVFRLFDGAGVRGAYISSNPDDGTLTLADKAPDWLQIIPSFRPYRPGIAGSTTWWKVDDTLDYTRARLALGHHGSIGEIHIPHPELLDDPVVKTVVGIAAEKGWFLHPHADARVVKGLFALHPDVKIVWAHAGFFEEPELVSAMMDKHKNLWADLSYREGDVMGDDGVSIEWKRVFLRHPDRFMVGSDTWVPERWIGYRAILDENRAWLGSLPRDVADKIAWKNAEALFGLKAPR